METIIVEMSILVLFPPDGCVRKARYTREQTQTHGDLGFGVQGSCSSWDMGWSSKMFPSTWIPDAAQEALKPLNLALNPNTLNPKISTLYPEAP